MKFLVKLLSFTLMFVGSHSLAKSRECSPNNTNCLCQPLDDSSICCSPSVHSSDQVSNLSSNFLKTNCSTNLQKIKSSCTMEIDFGGKKATVLGNTWSCNEPLSFAPKDNESKSETATKYISNTDVPALEVPDVQNTLKLFADMERFRLKKVNLFGPNFYPDDTIHAKKIYVITEYGQSALEQQGIQFIFEPLTGHSDPVTLFFPITNHAIDAIVKSSYSNDYNPVRDLTSPVGFEAMRAGILGEDTSHFAGIKNKEDWKRFAGEVKEQLRAGQFTFDDFLAFNALYYYEMKRRYPGNDGSHSPSFEGLESANLWEVLKPKDLLDSLATVNKPVQEGGYPIHSIDHHVAMGQFYVMIGLPKEGYRTNIALSGANQAGLHGMAVAQDPETGEFVAIDWGYVVRLGTSDPLKAVWRQTEAEGTSYFVYSAEPGSRTELVTTPQAGFLKRTIKDVTNLLSDAIKESKFVDGGITDERNEAYVNLAVPIIRTRGPFRADSPDLPGQANGGVLAIVGWDHLFFGAYPYESQGLGIHAQSKIEMGSKKVNVNITNSTTVAMHWFVKPNMIPNPDNYSGEIKYNGDPDQIFGDSEIKRGLIMLDHTTEMALNLFDLQFYSRLEARDFHVSPGVFTGEARNTEPGMAYLRVGTNYKALKGLAEDDDSIIIGVERRYLIGPKGDSLNGVTNVGLVPDADTVAIYYIPSEKKDNNGKIVIETANFKIIRYHATPDDAIRLEMELRLRGNITKRTRILFGVKAVNDVIASSLYRHSHLRMQAEVEHSFNESRSFIGSIFGVLEIGGIDPNEDHPGGAYRTNDSSIWGKLQWFW